MQAASRHDGLIWDVYPGIDSSIQGPCIKPFRQGNLSFPFVFEGGEADFCWRIIATVTFPAR